MKKLAISTILAAAMVLGFGPMSEPVQAAENSAENSKPLRGVVRPRKRVGGYSYKYLQGVDTRRFVDPQMQKQSISGPFDSGFFFSSPVMPRGGDSPYMQ